jgi:hypothetical protein
MAESRDATQGVEHTTFDDLRTELLRYQKQTRGDAEEIAHMLATGDYFPNTDVEDLRETGDAFQGRHEATAAALAQLAALETATLDGLLQAWAAHTNPALREIAHDYTKAGTLAY